MVDAVIRALGMAVAMGWEILWPLILGFALSAVVQAAVSKQQMSWLLPDDRPRSMATALARGAASSSCSYAAMALARSTFRKGAHFTAAMPFTKQSDHARVILSRPAFFPSHAVTDESPAAYSLVWTALLDRIVEKSNPPMGF